jgi:hypothetical protein
MAIFLTLQHVDGLRLRQQVAATVERVKGTETSDGMVVGAKEWHFEKKPGTREDVEVEQDRDKRNPDKLLGTYSPSISFGLKNLVVERKGAVTNIDFRNSSVRNIMRIKTQVLAPVGKKDKEGKDIKAWTDQNTIYLPPNQWGGFAVGEGLRIILDEMPT